MKCNNITIKLSAYIDNELKDDEIIEIKDHLLNCDECRKEQDRLLSVWNFIADYETIEPSSFLTRKIINKASSKNNITDFTEMFKTVFLPKPVFTSLVLIIGLFSGIFLGNNFILDSNNDILETNGNDNFAYLESFTELPSYSLGKVYINVLNEEKDLQED